MDPADLDLKRLKAAAAELARALHAEGIANLKIAVSYVEEDNYNGGSEIRIAEWRGRPNIYVTLDNFLGFGVRHFCVGFYSTKKTPINDLCESAPRYLQPITSLVDSDVVDQDDIWILQESQRKLIELSQPVIEHYRGNHWFCIYYRDLDIPKVIAFILGVIDGAYVADIENDGDLSPTEKAQLLKSRIGQGLFRERLMTYWENACAVSGCTRREVLRASHIQAWKDSNNKDRLACDNGFVLNAKLDALLGKDLITFGDD